VAEAGVIGTPDPVAGQLVEAFRATGGYTGARFLATVDELLQRPEDL